MLINDLLYIFKKELSKREQENKDSDEQYCIDMN